MKIVFLGTPKFGADILNGLLDAGREIVAVVCQPDRRGNRNKTEACQVKRVAEQRNLKVFQFEKISSDGAEDLKKLSADVFITAAYGQMLSEEILSIPKFGVFNAHGSLLPKYRGAAPVQTAIMNGDGETGVTIMKTCLAMDSGDIAARRKVDIAADDTAGTLLDKLAVQAVSALEEVLDKLENGSLSLEKQDEKSATYCGKISGEMAEIDWKMSAEEIFNRIRAFNPSPIASTTLNGVNFKIYQSEIVDGHGGAPGEIVMCDKNAVVVSCGVGCLRLVSMQLSGGKVLGYRDFVNGRKIKTGDILGK